MQTIDTEEPGWNFLRINSLKIFFYKTGELNGSSNVKIPLRVSAFLNNKTGADKYCFNWSILAHFHPCENSTPNRTSNDRQFFLKN